MQFRVQSRLHYQVNGPASVLASVRGLQSANQSLLEESLAASIAGDWRRYDESPALCRMDRFDPTATGHFTIDYEGDFDVSLERVTMTPLGKPTSYPDDPEVLSCLHPSRYAPSDRFRNVAHELFGHIEDPFRQAVAVEKWLFEKLSYIYGASDEQTWAPDTFESRRGVCRDYAHLGIAFCRALFLPARYVTGYCLGLEPQDFHAGFEVHIDGRWHYFDPTRLAPLNAMVRIARGHDAAETAVASLCGDILSTGMEIYVYEGNESREPFVPVNRLDLEEGNESLVFS